MSLQYLTGATSGTNYKISGYSATPSFGCALEQYNGTGFFDTLEWHGHREKLIESSRIPEHVCTYNGDTVRMAQSGMGLYADYVDNKYYWYVLNISNNYSGYGYRYQWYCVSLSFYNFDGTIVDPSSAPSLYQYNGTWQMVNKGEYYYEYSVTNLYLLDEATFEYLDSGYANKKIGGASVAFWPFHYDQYYDTCFIKGSKVLLSNGMTKNIEDIVPGDSVIYITDAGIKSVTTVVAKPQKGLCSEYINYIFEDGTILPIYKDQGIWCEEKQEYLTVLKWEIGYTTKKTDGTLTKLVDKQLVQKEDGAEDFEHYFLYTYNGNYSVNGVLTCTAREKAYQAYLAEQKAGSNFKLSDAQVRQWCIDMAKRHHKNKPLFNEVYSAIKNNINKQINKNEITIQENKTFLNNTDYKVQKYMEGVISEEEFNLIKIEREAARAVINNLELANENLHKELNVYKRKFEMKPTRPNYATMSADTQILMADGSYKAIKDVKVGDEVQYLSDDKQHVRTHKVVLPVEPEFVWEYKLYRFSDGTELKLHGQTNLFGVERNKYYPEKEMKVGDLVRKFDGTEVSIQSVEIIKLDKEETFYRISTRNGNFTMNNILSLVSQIRIYDEMMWEENEYFRLPDEEMEEWKNWCDAHR